MKLTNTKWIVAKILLVFALLGWISYELYAHAAGITGLTAPDSGGCYCHNSSSNSATSLTLTSSSGTFKVKPGNSDTYTLRVINTSESYAGCNIGVKTTSSGNTDAGSLSAVTGLKTSSGELTHDGKQQLNSSGYFEFKFSWTAPSTPGKYYIRALANAVNGNGTSDGGDQWNRLTTQEVIVPGLALDDPSSAASWCAGSDVTIKWTATGVDNVKIELSNNGGTDYQTVIAASAAGSAGTYTWSIPSDFTAGDNYKLRISDASDATMNKLSQTISIGGATIITSQPSAQQICEGSQLKVEVSATGAGLVYQWFKNGSPLPATNSKSFIKDNATPDDNGTYKVTITGACGNPVTSNDATVTVNEAAGITQQPVNQTVCSGQPASFTIKSKGLNKKIQWKKDGTNLEGKTDETLSIDNTTSNDEGTYTAVVTADCGTQITSSPALLSVGAAPAITTQPENSTSCEGTDVTLSVAATGTDLEYQWVKDGANVTDGITADYKINAIKKSDEGTYKVIVKNSCGSNVTSNEILVIVNTKPSFTYQPQSKKVASGSAVMLYVAAKGSGTLSYQWQLNGYNVAGATNDTLNIASLTADLAGNYTCIVTNGCGSITSQEANIQIKSDDGGPSLELATPYEDLGLVMAGTTKPVSFTNLLINSGNADLTITSISADNTTNVNIGVTNIFPLTIPAGGSATLNITVNPLASGPFSGKITFASNSQYNPDFPIAGNGYSNTDISPSVSQLDFPETVITKNSQKSVTIKNNSTVDFTVDQLKISGTNSDVFSIMNPTTPFTIAGGMQQVVNLSFNPTADGDFNASLDIYINGNSTDPILIPLKGTAILSSVIDNIAEISSASVYPNPANTGTFSVNLNLLAPKFLSLEAFDNLGQKVFSLPAAQYPSGINTIKFDLNNIKTNLPNGSYTIVISDGMGINVLRLVISK